MSTPLRATQEAMARALERLGQTATPPVDPERERKAIAAYNAALGMQPVEPEEK